MTRLRVWALPAVAVAVFAFVASPAAGAPATDSSALNMEVVGHNDLGGRGYNADVWVHDGYAYVGSWGFEDWANGSKNRFCPEPSRSGVKVVDVRDPANPTVVSTLQNPPNTSAEDVVVHTARYGPRAG